MTAMTDTTLDQTGTVGAKIMLIKALRTFTGLGLKEAKLVSDGIAARFIAGQVPAPDPNHAHSAHAVTVATHSVCLHCHALMPRAMWGAVFCGDMCYRSHRADTRQDNAAYLMDQEIRVAELHLDDLRQRRANLANGYGQD